MKQFPIEVDIWKKNLSDLPCEECETQADPLWICGVNDIIIIIIISIG